ncbi:MAG: hypothetical protein IJV20_10700, partial [Prevotella sp.]|nr:hypothetical protein [Prevotella sp.]
MICGQRYGLFLNEQGFGTFFLRHPLKMSYLCGMKRALRIRGRRIWAAVVAVAAAIALVAGGIAAWRHDRAMRAALR